MPSGALAQQPLKIGLILPMTGPFASTGRQVYAAVKLYVAQHGDVVAGRKIEVLLRDDANAPETTKRFAQELVTNDHAEILAGFGLTPLAFAAAPIATAAKVPMIVMSAGTLVIPEKSPYIVRTSFTLPQQTAPIAIWAPKHGIKKVFTLVTDYAPGIDAETTFKKVFTANGGQIVGEARVPVQNPDYAPFIQRAKDAKPDALFVFVPSGEGAAVMKQFAERGLAKAGIKLIGPGDVTDDDILDSMGDRRHRDDHVALLFGGPSLGREQGLRRGLREGEPRHAAELHVRRRLGRHGADLRGPEEDQRLGRRRQVHRRRQRA